MSLTRTFNITCNGVTKNSLADYGLAISNTNYIGDPIMEEFYIDVPSGPILDLCDALTGRPVFKQRTITLEVGALRNKDAWDSVISDFRNLYDGQKCKITFDNDTDWYWEGRIRITEFDRVQSLGTFTIIMIADAYKYKVTPVTDTYTLSDSSEQIALRSYAIPISPIFKATSGDITVKTYRQDLGTTSYILNQGVEFKVPALLTDTNLTISAEGTGTLQVIYREKSL